MIKLSCCQKSLLVAVQSVKGHICFTEQFLLKMGCEISSWRSGGDSLIKKSMDVRRVQNLGQAKFLPKNLMLGKKCPKT